MQELLLEKLDPHRMYIYIDGVNITLVFNIVGRGTLVSAREDRQIGP